MEEKNYRVRYGQDRSFVLDFETEDQAKDFISELDEEGVDNTLLTLPED